MAVTIKETTMVSPCDDTPKTSVWLSNMDLVMMPLHVTVAYFYKPDGSLDFFNTRVLKEALSKVLVPFYPAAGRFGYHENGRLEIMCNGKGVLFIEAETSFVVDDNLVQDFTDGSIVPQLVPKIDISRGISSFPLFALQVTRFKCGGVCIGVSFHHILVDGSSVTHFINSWADMARGLLSPTIPPFLDRTLLRARDQPTPRFRHVEYEPSPSSETNSVPGSKSFHSVFKITAEQVKALEAKVNEASTNTKYSTYSILTAHIWRCATKARDLSKDQEVKLLIAVDGRSRFQPPLPRGYFGNVVFIAAPVALAGEIRSESLKDTLRRIQAMNEMNNEYMRSAIDLIENTRDINKFRHGREQIRCPNLSINSWMRLPIPGADFGWGRPFFMRPVTRARDGLACILPTANSSDGSLIVVVDLETTAMKRFKNHFYEEFCSHEMHLKSSL